VSTDPLPGDNTSNTSGTSGRDLPALSWDTPDLARKIMPRPGFEPGSPTRKAGILSTPFGLTGLYALTDSILPGLCPGGQSL
jgi:hypothetical protein